MSLEEWGFVPSAVSGRQWVLNPCDNKCREKKLLIHWNSRCGGRGRRRGTHDQFVPDVLL